jgi:hypothetical protein
MERLSAPARRAPSLAPAARAAWELRRGARAFCRRFGLFGWALPGAAACALAGLVLAHHYSAELAVLKEGPAMRLAARASPRIVPAAPDDPAAPGARARLAMFDAQLLAQSELPFVVQDLLDLGAAEGLSMQRGAYSPQADPAGGFLRYRISFPVRGAGTAIQRFMRAAFRQHPNLALDSVHFKRARIGSADVEARIQLILLTKPSAVNSTPLSVGANGGSTQ